MGGGGSTTSLAAGVGAGPVEGDCGLLEGPRMVAIEGPAGSLFCIDSTEVTNAHYQRFMAAHVSLSNQEARCADNDAWGPPFEGDGKQPVTLVDFCDAVGYCAWAGKRLCRALSEPYAALEDVEDPARSEWSWACSAGGSRRFPYGDEFDGAACVSSLTDGEQAVSESDHSYPVASFPGCEGGFAGIFDMSGNVTEWEDACADGEVGKVCAVRGGGYTAPVSTTLDCATYLPPYPATQLYDAGIRCCADHGK